MIKFFSKIRYNLMSQNKTGRYIKYAFGEIILVVIGILLALQINTWNQNRLDDLERKQIIKNLNTEFKQNKKQLLDIVASYEKAKKSSLALMDFVGLDKEKPIVKKEIDSLIDKMFTVVDYLPSNNAINDIIQSGKLKSLGNSKLSTKLSDWQSLIYICASREEKIEHWIFVEVLPYLDKYISQRDVGVAGNYNWSTPGKLPTNYEYIFTDLEFENILENYLFFVNECHRRYLETVELVEEIIVMTNES